MTSTRVERRKHHQALKVMGFPERVALFVAAIHRPRAEELLSGFSKSPQERASAFAEDMKQWDSARRQARLAHEFGVRHDAGERLQQLVVRTTGELRAAIVASLPPAVRAVAARLVKEASR